MHTKKKRYSIRMLALVLLLPQSDLVSGATSNGVEIKPFALLDSDASFTARYLFDERTDNQGATESSFEERVTWEEELWFRTKSYVYHPGFLNIDLDIGPKLVQQRFDSNAGSNDNDEDFLQFLARLNFLELKNYPFSLYYGRSNPSVTSGLTGRFVAERKEYGTNARFLGPHGIVLAMDLGHLDYAGTGFGRVVDDVEDRGSITLSTSYRDGDTIELKYGQSTRDSSSGSPGLPIQQSKIRQDASHVITRNRFGSDRNYLLTQSYYGLKEDVKQVEQSDVDNWRYNSTLRLIHSEETSSFVEFDSMENRRTGSRAERQELTVGVDHAIREGLKYGLKASDQSIRQTGFQSDRLEIGADFSYQKPTRYGVISLGGNVLQARTDQDSTADTVQVFDEIIVLNGTTPVSLADEFVLPQSVVVSNEARTQQYVEGMDYRLVIVGSLTRIQRLIGGNIQDGETVLVDYLYQTSGTAEFDTFTSGLGVSFNFLKYVTASVWYNQRDTSLLGGELTTPVNDQDVLQVAVGADLPYSGRWALGGELRHEDKNEDISPYVSDAFSVHATAALWRSMRLYLSGSLLRTDLEKSEEDIDQAQFRMGLSGQLFRRAHIAYDLFFLRDTGGSLEREQLKHRLNYQWHYRAVRFYLRAEYIDESQGETDRVYKRVTAQVTRFF